MELDLISAYLIKLEFQMFDECVNLILMENFLFVVVIVVVEVGAQLTDSIFLTFHLEYEGIIFLFIIIIIIITFNYIFTKSVSLMVEPPRILTYVTVLLLKCCNLIRWGIFHVTVIHY